MRMLKSWFQSQEEVMFLSFVVIRKDDSLVFFIVVDRVLFVVSMISVVLMEISNRLLHLWSPSMNRLRIVCKTVLVICFIVLSVLLLGFILSFSPFHLYDWTIAFCFVKKKKSMMVMKILVKWVFIEIDGVWRIKMEKNSFIIFHLGY